MADDFLSFFLVQLNLKRHLLCFPVCALCSLHILAAFECIIENGVLRLLVQEFFFKHNLNACVVLCFFPPFKPCFFIRHIFLSIFECECVCFNRGNTIFNIYV